MNSRDYKTLSETYQLLTQSQIKYHEQTSLKYRASSIGKGKAGGKQKLPEISIYDLTNMNGEKFNVPYIDYEKELSQSRDWTIVLGKGVQGTVEKMILKLKDGSEVGVAVKKTYLTQQRARRIEVYKRELRALQRISNPNVVKLWGLGVDPCDEFIYLVLELCDCSGWEYVDRVFSKSLEFPKDILFAWADLANGCDEMAKKGILHRDLTLDNILVT